MIRVVQRHLIIPRGDTGSFTLPLLSGAKEGDVAIFSIYDPLYQKTVLQKEITVGSGDTLTFEFISADTQELEPSPRYEWDVRIYHNEVKNENDEVVEKASVDSYYAAFKLPSCEIAVAP